MSEPDLLNERQKEKENFISCYRFYDGVGLPSAFVPDEDRLKHLMKAESYDDDVWVVTFPKCGTTWMQAMIALIMIGEEKIEKEGLTVSSMYSFFEGMMEGATGDGLENLRQAKRPRLVKSHLQFHLLPQELQNHTAKLIYVARNPKDACTSYYNFTNITVLQPNMTHIGDYYDLFRHGQVYGGSWFDHVRKFWMERNHKNVLFVTYEQMSKDLRGVISLVAGFLGRTLSDDQLTRFTDILTFHRMKNNPAFNYELMGDSRIFDFSKGEFLRKGVVGDWRNAFTEEMSQEVDEAFLKPIGELGLVFDEL